MTRYLLTLAVVLVLSTPLSAAEPVKIVFLGQKPDHPYASHMYLFEANLLAKCARQTAGVTTEVSEGWPTDPKVLEGARAVVLYTSSGAEFLFGGKHSEQVEELAKRGVGFVAVHWSTGANKEELGLRYAKIFGGYWFINGGLKTDPFRVVQVAKDHPLSRGWGDYESKEEIYLNPRLGPDAKPVIQVRVGDKDHVVAWAHERAGGGRSFATTLGHYHEAFKKPEFRRVLTNAILWTAKLEVPAAGAPCEATEEDLKLPPEKP